MLGLEKNTHLATVNVQSSVYNSKRNPLKLIRNADASVLFFYLGESTLVWLFLIVSCLLYMLANSKKCKLTYSLRKKVQKLSLGLYLFKRKTFFPF